MVEVGCVFCVFMCVQCYGRCSMVMLLDVCLRVVSLLIKAPAAAGAFYFFNSPTNPINQPSIPGITTNKTVTAFTYPVP